MQVEHTPMRARAEDRFPKAVVLSDAERDHPSILTIVKILYNMIVRLFHDPVGMILASAFVLIMIWGFHGNLELLGLIWDGWTGPGSAGNPARQAIIPGIPWDQEWLSFIGGAVLLVLIPSVLIKYVYKQSLSDYGLGLPRDDRRRLTLLSAVLLFVLSLPAFYVGAQSAQMQAVYPLYRDFHGPLQFVIYEMGYLVFFVVIEFIFRGYLLFGLFRLQDQEALPGVGGIRGPLVFGYYAVFIAMLSYTAWHLGKPLPELGGTLMWGIAAGGIALTTGTILHLILVHWLLNVFMDLLIWQQWFF